MCRSTQQLLLLGFVGLAASVDTCVTVSTAVKALAAAIGTYCEDGFVNGAPRYRQQTGDDKPRWLYRAAKGVWSFTAHEAGIAKGKGTIVSEEKAFDSPIGLNYTYYVSTGATWSGDDSFVVSEIPEISSGDASDASEVDTKTSTSNASIMAGNGTPCLAQFPYPQFSGSLVLPLRVRAADGTQSSLLIEVPVTLDGTLPLGQQSLENSGIMYHMGVQFLDLCANSMSNEYLEQLGGSEACAIELLSQLEHKLHENICKAAGREEALERGEMSMCLSLDGYLVLDRYPWRSPLVLADYLADKVRGKSVVEIGSENGDVLGCLARVASKTISIERDQRHCSVLLSRGISEVICDNLLEDIAGAFVAGASFPNADVYFMWMDGASASNLVGTIHRTLHSRGVSAEVYFWLDFEIDEQAQAYDGLLEQLRGLDPAATVDTVAFDEAIFGFPDCAIGATTYGCKNGAFLGRVAASGYASIFRGRIGKQEGQS
jgi:hypothetical protein